MNKKVVFSTLVLLIAATAFMSSSWAQPAPAHAAPLATPAVQKKADAADAAPSQLTLAAKKDRRNKAAETASNMQKKTDDTSKTVNGNLK